MPFLATHPWKQFSTPAAMVKRGARLGWGELGSAPEERAPHAAHARHANSKRDLGSAGCGAEWASDRVDTVVTRGSAV